MATSTVTRSPRTPLRADAARNRELVLDAAGRLFREHGLDVTMQEVADEAGVGVGTIARRFGGKDELVAALVDERYARLLATLRRGIDGLADDPWAAFADAFTHAVELHVRDRGFIEAVADSRCRADASSSRREELVALLDQLVRGAIDAGVVRADLTAADIPVLACMVGRSVASAAGPMQADAWRRACMIVLDGMRAD